VLPKGRSKAHYRESSFQNKGGRTLSEYTILDLVVLFGGFFALVLTFGQLLKSPKDTGNYLLAGLLFCTGFTLILNGVYKHGMYTKTYQILHGISISTWFCLGPILYLFFLSMLEESFLFKKRYLIHFLSTPLSAMVLLLLSRGVSLPLDRPPYGVRILAGASSASTMIYILLAYGHTVYLLKTMPQEKRKELFPGFLCYFFIFIFSGIDIANRIFHWQLNTLMNACVTFLIVVYFLMGNKYPVYLRLLREERKRIKYEASRLHGLNIHKITLTLESLMKDEKIYSEESLSMPLLAKRLNITAQQLSELLNCHYKRNFYSFINQYRIEEAIYLLMENKAMSVLDIAFTVGFESSSAFYAAFQRQTGLSPSKFRKARLT